MALRQSHSLRCPAANQGPSWLSIRIPDCLTHCVALQLIGDQARGHAWTRALQGIPANEIHLCGDQSALNVVRQLCDSTDEALEVKQYQRWGHRWRSSTACMQGAHRNVADGQWQHTLDIGMGWTLLDSNKHTAQPCRM